jgi:hypothetical protein
MCKAVIANSWCVPRRAGCGTEVPSAARTFSGSLASKGVSKRPGAIAQTRIWRYARSRAATRVIPTTPALDAAYGIWPI